MSISGDGGTAAESTAASDNAAISTAATSTAVIGMALRLPGADTTGAYWRTIRSARSHIHRFTTDELIAAGVDPALAASDGFTGASAPLSRIAEFDAPFFSMSGKESVLTDPQNRLFMECCHHALENAGYAGDQGRTRTGVYASSGFHIYPLQSYLHNNMLGDGTDKGWLTGLHRTLGGYTDFIATRTAFRLGLTGPAFGLQSACSSSLVAVHLARQALMTDDADIAVAGAAAVHVPQVLGYAPAPGSVISPSGRCRPFDAEADGTVGGNGVAAVVLKRLDRALADGDTVHAVIRGSAVNNDGRGKRHFTEPSSAGQREVIRRALAAAGVSAESIGYVETHGTGTFKGDPIEFDALTRAFAEETDRTGYCALGAVKGNIGHLDVCSGLAGLIKAVLVLRHGTIPPLAGFTTANPLLALEGSPFYLPAELGRWPEGRSPRRASVTSLGVGGTNAHLVLEEAPRRGRVRGPSPARVPAPAPAPDAASAPGLVPLSGLGPEALLASAVSLRRHLALNPAARHEDLVTTQALGRRHLRHRLVLFGEDRAELTRSLDDFLGSARQSADEGGEAPQPGGAHGPRRRWAEGVVPRTRLAPVGWMFSGQGGNRPGMARELYERFAPVRRTVDTCEELYRDVYGRSLLALLTAPAPKDSQSTLPPGRPEDGQAALFALQAAQCELWRQLCEGPSIVTGHSVGEYGALFAAGALSLEDGVRITAERGRLMHSGCAEGGMLAVFADEAAVSRLLDEHGELDLAAVNGEHHHVLAGPVQAVDRVEGELAARSVRCHRLIVERAFHSRLVDPVLDELQSTVAGFTFRPTELPFVSGVDGRLRPPRWLPDAAYLRGQAREPVRFGAALRELTGAGCVLLQELGPGSVLSGLAAREHPAVTALPTSRTRGGLTPLWTALGESYCRGYALRWQEAVDGSGGRRVPMPGYPFQRKPYWTGPELIESAGVKKVLHDEEDEGGSLMTGQEEEVLAQVIRLTAEHLGIEEAECDAEVPFFDLGADSLRTINLLQEVEHLLGVKVGMREVFDEADSPLLLARLIARRGGEAPRTPAEPDAPTIVPSTAVQAASQEQPQEQPLSVDDGGPYATQASLDALSAQVDQLIQNQLQLMRQVSELLATGLHSAPNGEVAR